MAKFGYSSRYEKFAKELITNILGFKTGDENFTSSMNYVMSNLLYHHCLDVNSHQVQESLQGIIFKMTIHGHQKKAEKLNLLTKQLLSAPELQDQGDVKWSILSLLIDLGQHPARDSLSSSMICEASDGDLEAKGFQEMDLVLELTDKLSHLPDRDETLSEWSDDDEMRRSYSLATEQGPQTSLKNSIQATSQKEILNEERGERSGLVKEFHLAKSWLSNAIQKPYWDSEEKLIITSHDQKSFPVLTEYTVMRECIWVLLHPSSGYLFIQKGKDFVTRPCCLSSLSQDPLRELLQPIALAASKLLAIDSWLVETQFSSLKEDGRGWGALSSYSDGVRKWRRALNRKLNSLEKEVFNGAGTPTTMLWLLHQLDSHLSNLSTIYNVHSKAFNEPEEVVLKKTFKLLSILVQSVEGGGKKCDRTLLLFLFNHALKNHLKSLYCLLWGNAQQREMLLQEFGIIKKCSPKHSYCFDTCGYIDLPGLDFLRVLRAPLIKISELKEVIKDVQVPSYVEFKHLESVTENRLKKKFLRTIESAEVWKNEMLGEKLNLNIAMEEGKESSHMKEVKPGENEVDCFANGEGEEWLRCTEEKSIGEFNSVGEDVYLMKAFQEEEINEDLKESNELDIFECTRGVEHLLSSLLLPIVQKRYDQFGKMVMKSLVHTHGLRHQMETLIGVVLLSSTHLMSDFYSDLFQKIDRRDVLEENDLTQNLQYCISSSSYASLAKWFGISFNQEPKTVSKPGKTATNSLTEAMLSISVDFMDLWPISMVLNEDLLSKYNRVFGFCLMLKKAVYTLERLHFREIASFDSCYSNFASSSTTVQDTQTSVIKKSDPQLSLAHRVHRLQLLRQWLLYFARVLHDHFNCAILMPFSKKVEELFHEEEHFHDFINEHERLLSNVCHQCLLNEAFSPIKKALSQMFCTVERVRDLWVGPPDKITGQELESLEDQYSSCHKFMTNFLSTLALSQFCPLVEGLAQSLMYSCPT